jgi:thioredoxin 1
MDEELEAIRRRKMSELKSDVKADSKMPATPIVVNDADFDKFVTKYPVVLIDCWAPWCGPCRMVAPVIDALAREMSGTVVFGKLNTDENSAVPNKFSISAIPTMLIFKEGKMVDRIVGAQPKEALAARIKRNL